MVDGEVEQLHEGKACLGGARRGELGLGDDTALEKIQNEVLLVGPSARHGVETLDGHDAPQNQYLS